MRENEIEITQKLMSFIFANRMYTGAPIWPIISIVLFMYGTRDSLANGQVGPICCKRDINNAQIMI